MKINITPTIMGRVRIEKGTEAKGVTEVLEFDNAFLVGGVRDISKRIVEPPERSGLHGRQSLMLFLGTGTTTPTQYDLGLESRSGDLPGKVHTDSFFRSVSERIGEEVGEDKVVISSWELTFRYGAGEAEGVWTEVGLANEDYSVAHTRALIRDEEGQPISLTVLADEFLAVYYTIEVATKKFYDLGIHEINGNQHHVYYFNRRSSFISSTSSSNRTAGNFGWGLSGGRITGIRRHNLTSATFDPETGEYSFTTSTTNNRNPTMAGFNIELDLDSLGYKWQTHYGPNVSDVSIPLIWPNNGDNGVIYFDPPVVVPTNHRIYFEFHTRFTPENYDKTMDPTYDPDFDPDLQGGA